MPTYEYECKKCHHSFEVFQAMSDEPLKQCPKCKKELRRLIFGGAGVIFKGPGFYVTDKASGKVSGTQSKPADTAASASADKAGSTACSGNEAPCSGCPKNKSKSSAKSA